MIIQKTIVKVVKTFDIFIVTLEQQVASSFVTNGCCSRIQKKRESTRNLEKKQGNNFMVEMLFPSS